VFSFEQLKVTRRGRASQLVVTKIQKIQSILEGYHVLFIFIDVWPIFAMSYTMPWAHPPISAAGLCLTAATRPRATSEPAIRNSIAPSHQPHPNPTGTNKCAWRHANYPFVHNLSYLYPYIHIYIYIYISLSLSISIYISLYKYILIYIYIYIILCILNKAIFQMLDCQQVSG